MSNQPTSTTPSQTQQVIIAMRNPIKKPFYRKTTSYTYTCSYQCI